MQGEDYIRGLVRL